MHCDIILILVPPLDLMVCPSFKVRIRVRIYNILYIDLVFVDQHCLGSSLVFSSAYKKRIRRTICSYFKYKADDSSTMIQTIFRLTIMTFVLTVVFANRTSVELLYTDLLRDYNHHIRPNDDQTQRTVISVTMHLISINEIEELTGAM